MGVPVTKLANGYVKCLDFQDLLIGRRSQPIVPLYFRAGPLWVKNRLFAISPIGGLFLLENCRFGESWLWRLCGLGEGLGSCG